MTILTVPYDFAALNAHLEKCKDPDHTDNFIAAVAAKSSLHNKLIIAAYEDAAAAALRSLKTCNLPKAEQNAIYESSIIKAFISLGTLLTTTIPPEDHYDAAQFIAASALKIVASVSSAGAK